MREILKDRDEVAHYWANQVQPRGRANNLFFEGPYLWSYGKHFCVGRVLPSGSVALSTRKYSPSTGQHQAKARKAVRQERIVWCYDAAASASDNRRWAIKEITEALADAEKKGIRQTTRDKHKIRVLTLTDRFNDYRAALPPEEQSWAQPIVLDDLPKLRVLAVAQARREAEERQARDKLHAEAHAEQLATWRRGGPLTSLAQHGPVALRLYTCVHVEPCRPELATVAEAVLRPVRRTEQRIETSHGAHIPVEDAKALWPAILEARSTKTKLTLPRPLGVYQLSAINEDGSIVVGCHDIAFDELNNMAGLLGLNTKETA